MNKKQRKKQVTSSKESNTRPNIVLIAILIILGLITIVSIIKNNNRSVINKNSTDSSKKLSVYKSSEDVIKNLGKTVLIGDDLKFKDVEGTTFIDVNDLPGLNDVLNGRSVDALEALLKQNKIKAVIVSPFLTKRNPIPENTVRNRLALANPAKDFGAVYMCRDFFIYKPGRGAPGLTAKDKRDLISIVRFNAKAADAMPKRLSPILTKQGKWQVILTVRPFHGKHLSFHSVKSSTLKQAAQTLASRLVRYYNRKGFSNKFGPVTEALKTKIGLEMEVVYDRGIFTGNRDRIFMWRIFEPGIYGEEAVVNNRRIMLPPWYSVANNLRTLSSIMNRIFVKIGRDSATAWLNKDTPLWRFRTVHWREKSAGGAVQDLYRGLTHVTDTKEITKESLLASLKGFGDWLAFNSRDYTDNRMIYRYFPTKDEENNEYNMVRHALGAYSLALVQELLPPDDNYKKVADSCLKWLEKRLRWGGFPRRGDGTLDDTVDSWQGKPLPGKNVAIIDADENMYDNTRPAAWSNKMGMVAVAILGYTQFKKAGWELSDERKKILKGLADFILYMQKKDGSFHHYYVARQNSYYGKTNSIYPGEILYAIARLYGETGDERFKIAFKQSMKTNLDWFKREMSQKEADGTYEESRRKELVQFQPWIAMSMEEMYRYDKNPAYLKASNLVSLWILDTYQYDETRSFYPDYLGGYMKVLDELPAMHTFVYTEGTAASYVLARSAGASKSVINKLRKGSLLSARFILQQQIRKNEGDYYYPNPDRAAGGIKYCLNHNKQRIDYNYHALSSIYRIIHAATPEDYQFIHTVN